MLHENCPKLSIIDFVIPWVPLYVQVGGVAELSLSPLFVDEKYTEEVQIDV